MIFPWSRHDWTGTGAVVSREAVSALLERTWPIAGYSGDIRARTLEAGDPHYWVPEPWQAEIIRKSLPDIGGKYRENAFDCENFSRRRMSQVDEFMERRVRGIALEPAIFEVRGMSGEVGHSMLLAAVQVGTLTAWDLWQPYDGLERQALSHLKDPWLVYR